RGQGRPGPPQDPLGLGPGRFQDGENGPPRGREFGPPDEMGPDGPPGRRPNFRPGLRQGEGPPNGNIPPRFMVHTSNPSRYWVGVRVHHSEGDHIGPMPVTLMVMSSSIRGGGLFVDFMPW